MNRYFADFHVHIGTSHGRPVKISAANNMTLEKVLHHARDEKGLDVITVIDGICRPVQSDVQKLLDVGDLALTSSGGYLYQDKLLVILGAEIEIAGPRGGAAHFGCWLPTLAAAADFSDWLRTVQKNIDLSSQRAYTSATELQQQVRARDGLFVIHHAFTPHKGIYGNCVEHLSDMVDVNYVDALELGLSADTDMGDSLSELSSLTFLTNSDAHSLPKIAREYNQLMLADLNFNELRMALRRQSGRALTANFGLEPRLGKYHRSTCNRCGKHVTNEQTVCSCGGTRFTPGVFDRWLQIRDFAAPKHPSHRPPYYQQIPLEFVPGLGPKTREKLIQHFQSEMAVIHDATVEEITAVCNSTIAERIDRARRGALQIAAGGGGDYGKILIN